MAGAGGFEPPYGGIKIQVARLYFKGLADAHVSTWRILSIGMQ
ncbi:MAG: hypothetical protein RIQ68_1066 [Pseudomonadota bacterium]|jgi:hypothetical protein